MSISNKFLGAGEAARAVREEKSSRNGTQEMYVRDSPGRIPKILGDKKTKDGRKGQR